MCGRICILLGTLALLVGCPDADVVVGGSSGTGDAAETGIGDGDGDGVADHRSYFISETTEFNGGGQCDNAELSAVTSTLREDLADAGWVGLRFVNENTWPEDFQEGTIASNGLDDQFGDAVRLVVYAGHGAAGQIQWGTPSPNGECLTIINSDSRLGTLAGDTAAAVMLLSSCTMRIDQLWPIYKEQMTRQIFGYHNSPNVGHDELRKVFARTQDGQSTADAWLEEMVISGTANNSPVVFTKGTSGDEATEMHGATNLATGEGFFANVPEPADYYHFELFDSGCSTVCGACTGSVVAVPELTMGAATRRVKLTRPTRTARDLVERVTAALPLFDVAVLDDARAARLREWAFSIATSGDIAYALVLDDPRIDVSYDPESDFLRITNRDALARARPRAGASVDEPPELPDALLLEAQAVRAKLQAIPGGLDLLDTEFDVTTRVVGHGHDDEPADTTIYETIFTLAGRLEGLALPARHLGIGVTRLGELSTLTVSQIEVEIVGNSRFERQAQQAIDALVASVLVQYPSATDVEIVEPQIGYALTEAEVSAVTEPSLLAGYVLRFGDGNDAVASRRYPVRISLADPDAPIESLAAFEQDPSPGDDRASN